MRQAESKEIAQQAREAAKDLNIMRLIRNRDDIRRTIMTLDVLYNFSEDMRAAMYRFIRTLYEIVHWDVSWSYAEAAALLEFIWKELTNTWKEIMGRSTLMESQQRSTAPEIVDDLITEIKARNQLGAFNTESISYQLLINGMREQLKASSRCNAYYSPPDDTELAPNFTTTTTTTATATTTAIDPSAVAVALLRKAHCCMRDRIPMLLQVTHPLLNLRSRQVLVLALVQEVS